MRAAVLVGFGFGLLVAIVGMPTAGAALVAFGAAGVLASVRSLREVTA